MSEKNKTYKTKAAGKLFLSGEYAVVEKSMPAIVFAVDRFIYSEIKEIKESVKIKSDNKNTIILKRSKDETLKLDDLEFTYVIKSINLFEGLLRDLNKERKFFSLKITSELFNEQKVKYGLGSSAAVVVSVIKALGLFYDIPLSKMALFKLAAIVNFKESKKASAADIAASVYGGMLYFVSFDKEWLESSLESLSLKSLLNSKWPDLKIESLKISQEFKILVGWTKSPAKTKDLVKKVLSNKRENLDFYNDFLLKSQSITNALAMAIDKGHVKKLEELVNKNRMLLKEFSEIFKMEIETDKLTKLINLANNYGLAAKTSGAGGGDCGIAVARNNKNVKLVKKAWQQNGIEVLDLNIFKENKND